MFSTLLFTLIGFELTIAFMLLMPLFDSSKVAFFDFVDQQSWAKTFGTFLNGVFVLIAGLLVTTLPKLFWSHSAMEIEQLLVQRDCFLSIFALTLLGINQRYYQLLRQNHKLFLSHTALNKQAQGQAESSKIFLDQISGLEKENLMLQNFKRMHSEIVATSDSSLRSDNSLLEDDGDKGKVQSVLERDVWQLKAKESEKRCREMERNLELVTKQALAQSNEYTRLLKEKEILQGQLEDYSLVFGGGKKKSE